MDFRKIFKRNNNSDNGIEKKGFRKLLDKEGFYIILFLCVCIVGTTAVWVAKSNIDRIAEDDMIENEDMNIAESETMDAGENEIENQMTDIVIVDKENEAGGQEIAEKEMEENSSQENSDSDESVQKKKGKTLVQKQTPATNIALNEENSDSEAVAAANDQEIKMIWPSQGELGMEYAVETLTYSKTLEHFTTHHGIDIMAEEKTPVKAALAGEVIEVLTDSRLGLTISLKHENGLVTRYSNLWTDAMVNVGDMVTQGQTISGIGTSSLFESAEGPHLHFEILLNGENVNPFDYLAEQ